MEGHRDHSGTTKGDFTTSSKGTNKPHTRSSCPGSTEKMVSQESCNRPLYKSLVTNLSTGEGDLGGRDGGSAVGTQSNPGERIRSSNTPSPRPRT